MRLSEQPSQTSEWPHRKLKVVDRIADLELMTSEKDRNE